MNTFIKENDVVQVIDPTTGIWTDAKVLGFESDTRVRVDFIGWPKASSKVIVTFEGWNVRRQVKKKSAVEGVSRRASAQHKLDYEPSMRVKNDIVYFVGRVHEDPADLKTPNELMEENAASTQLHKGWVCFNDPFNRRMQIWTGETEDGGPVKDLLEYVHYCQLRLDTWVHPSETVAVAPQDDEDTPPEPRRKVNVHFLLC